MDKAEFLRGFGLRVKERRIQLGLSQEELANLMGYSKDNARSSISKLEAGKADLPVSRMYSLARALGVSVGELMGWE